MSKSRSKPLAPMASPGTKADIAMGRPLPDGFVMMASLPDLIEASLLATLLLGLVVDLGQALLSGAHPRLWLENLVEHAYLLGVLGIVACEFGRALTGENLGCMRWVAPLACAI